MPEINTKIYLKKKKNEKREYGRKRCHSTSKEKKQILKEYPKIIVKLRSLNLVVIKIVSQLHKFNSVL